MRSRCPDTCPGPELSVPEYRGARLGRTVEESTVGTPFLSRDRGSPPVSLPPYEIPVRPPVPLPGEVVVEVVDGLVLRVSPKAPREARRKVAAVCAHLPVEVAEAAGLVTSELVTNAVLHTCPVLDGAAEPVVMVVFRLTTTSLRVEITDQDPRPPQPRSPGGPLDSGWGMHLTAHLARGWGVQPLFNGRGKTVWFELGTAPDSGRS